MNKPASSRKLLFLTPITVETKIPTVDFDREGSEGGKKTDLDSGDFETEEGPMVEQVEDSEPNRLANFPGLKKKIENVTKTGSSKEICAYTDMNAVPSPVSGQCATVGGDDVIADDRVEPNEPTDIDVKVEFQHMEVDSFSKDTKTNSSKTEKSKRLSGLMDRIVSNFRAKSDKSCKLKDSDLSYTPQEETSTSFLSTKPLSSTSQEESTMGVESDELELNRDQGFTGSEPRSKFCTSIGISTNMPSKHKQFMNTVSRQKKRTGTRKNKFEKDRLNTRKKRSEVVRERSGVRKGRSDVSKEGSDIRRALVELQEARTEGTWVQCSRRECAKWRYLEEKDPSLVQNNWVCGDNPDIRFSRCSADEQDLEEEDEEKFVENRFTVGSLVWAKMVGWPMWPAMVDDDPETGDFFWTGVRGGRWEGKPSHYHVVFFDKEERGVSRAWVADRMVEKLTEENNVRKLCKIKHETRLKKAVELALKAGNMHLDVRRKKFGFANNFTGTWGSVWPEWCGPPTLQEDAMDVTADESRTVLCDSHDESSEFGSFFKDSEEDVENEARTVMPPGVSGEILSTMKKSYQNISMTNEEFLTDISEPSTSSKPKSGHGTGKGPEDPVAKNSWHSTEIILQKPPAQSSHEESSLHTEDMF